MLNSSTFRFLLLTIGVFCAQDCLAAGPGGDDLNERLGKALVNVRRDRPWRTAGTALLTDAPRISSYDVAAAAASADRQANWSLPCTCFFETAVVREALEIESHTSSIDATLGQALEEDKRFELAEIDRSEEQVDVAVRIGASSDDDAPPSRKQFGDLCFRASGDALLGKSSDPIVDSVDPDPAIIDLTESRPSLELNAAMTAPDLGGAFRF